MGALDFDANLLQEGGDLSRAREVLREVFGFAEFREGQDEVVARILSGRDGLVVMPTGGGKSLCYQLPALCGEGLTVVVSPLIALMKDQVDGLRARGVEVAFYNSSQTGAQQREVLRQVQEGGLRLLYVAPERFRDEGFCAVLARSVVRLLAIDEAHCLSQWGHDFRPDYLRLGQARDRLGRPPCVAFTATATPRVRADIREVLGLEGGFELVRGFRRPNLHLKISPTQKLEEKMQGLREVIARHGTGLVYCATRKRVEEVAEGLHAHGVLCGAYHGGMGDEERQQVQEEFSARRLEVVVATNAFGMGIDRADVRFVAHYEIPGSVEAYYQEAGRAGRDGMPAHCELFFNYADTRTQEFFIEGVNPSARTIRDIYGVLLKAAGERGETSLSLEEIAEAAEVRNPMAVGAALRHLGRAGYLERQVQSGSRRRLTRLLGKAASGVEVVIDETALEEKEARDRRRLEAVVEFCYAQECRQQWILRYFGEEESEPCGNCDCCESGQGGEWKKPSESQHELVRKALSGVARASRRVGGQWEGIFGRQKIALMLVGSGSQALEGTSLTGLSTYGILSDLSVERVRQLLEALQGAGLLRTQGGSYPLLTLTSKGQEVMKGQRDYQMRWPSGVSRVGGVGAKGGGEEDPLRALSAEGRRLYDKLRARRAELSREHGIPAYLILSNRALVELARERPGSAFAAADLAGMGKKSAHKWYESFSQVWR